jgi:hypothetical protein
MKKAAVLIILSILLTGFASAGERKITLSVMDLNITSGITQKEVVMLTDKLLNELVQMRYFEVVERSKRDEILKEQGFQMTGACDQTSCLVEAGQLLGAQKMIGGTIGKFGAVYAVELRMIDIGTGKVDCSFSKQYAGDLSNLLNAVKEAAEAFSCWRPSIAGSETQKSGLMVLSNPDQAKVIVDGREFGETPKFVYPLESGLHQIVILKDGYNLFSVSAVVKSGAVDSIRANLEKTSGKVRIVTDPDGAKIYLNDEYKGKTGKQGLLMEDLPVFPYRVTVSKNGYKNYQGNVLPVSGRETTIEAKLQFKRWWIGFGGGIMGYGDNNISYMDLKYYTTDTPANGHLEWGYRIWKPLAVSAGFQFHSLGIFTTQQITGDSIYGDYNKDMRQQIKFYAFSLGLVASNQWGIFEPYAETRFGTLMAKTDEYITSPLFPDIENTSTNGGYFNFQAGIGCKIWLSGTTALVISEHYNRETINDLATEFWGGSYGTFKVWGIKGSMGLEFAF